MKERGKESVYEYVFACICVSYLERRGRGERTRYRDCFSIDKGFLKNKSSHC